MNKFKAVIINLSLLFGTVLFVFALAEVAARLVLPKQRVKKSPQIKHLPSNTLGWVIAPQQHSYTFAFPVTINAEGWRYREFSPQKPPNVTRILSLGDSLTFGAGVRTEDTYPAQLETLLNQGNSSKQIEVINMGVFGYGTWQAVDVLKQKGLDYQPDLVLLGFYINDPEDTARYYPYHQQMPGVGAENTSPVVEAPSPPTTVPSDTDREASSGKKNTLRQWLSNHLKGKRLLPRPIIYLLQNSRFAYYIGWRINQLVVHESSEPQLLAGESSAEIERAWKLVAEALQELVQLSQEHHFKVLLIIFPSPMQMAQEFPHERYQSIIKSLADKYAIPTLDVRKKFREAYTTFESLFIPYDGHPNERAYQITAQQLSLFLKPLLKNTP